MSSGEREFSFPSTGDPAKDAQIAEEFCLHTERLEQGICPNGCGPLVATDAHNRDCPSCGFHGWSNVPHRQPTVS